MSSVSENDVQGFTLCVETGPVSLMWLSSVFIRIPEIANSVLDSNGSRDVAKRVPVVSDPDQILYDDSSIHSRDSMPCENLTLKQLHIRLTDENSNDIPVRNSWSFSLTFSEHC